MAARSETPRDSERSQALLKKIKRAFETFDLQNNSTCDVREVGTIIRSLNIYPSEEQLHGWIKEMEEDEPTGYITFQKFSKTALRILSSNAHVRDDDEKLFRAFQILDAEKRGYLLPDELRSFMTSHGEPFSHEEIEEMLTACTDPAENKVYYEDYIALG
ncbi:hypothetical protein HK105_203324 [Polyrhizophydium stewartii]|uniref:EF-hand domain-containing protein n=1 Tax=Polyrhizophydium stewartii TaxID=2732419 RepID=A0ABR4NCI5_9FUNG